MEIKDLIPSVYYLAVNYPNPFIPIIKISYALPERNFIQLKVYYILGNEVTSLVYEVAAGHYEIEFIATGLSSGVYFYQIQAGRFIGTKKIVLMKLKVCYLIIFSCYGSVNVNYNSILIT